VILFGRNIRDPAQLAGLVADVRAVLPPGAVLMLDQEGGRVARLRPPHWRAHPPARAIGAVFGRFAGGRFAGRVADRGVDWAAMPGGRV
jgi:beta-N-acetylhexosaminidase